MVSFCEKWLTMDALCHAKFANHHCRLDALALIMQTGYEVGSLSVPVISRINDWAGYIGVATPFLYVQWVALPLFTMARGSTTPFFQRPKINPGYYMLWVKMHWIFTIHGHGRRLRML